MFTLVEEFKMVLLHLEIVPMVARIENKDIELVQMVLKEWLWTIKVDNITKEELGFFEGLNLGK